MFSVSSGQEPAKRAENFNQITGFPGTVKQRDRLNQAASGGVAGARSEPTSTQSCEAGSFPGSKKCLYCRSGRKRLLFGRFAEFEAAKNNPRIGGCEFARGPPSPKPAAKKRAKNRKKSFSPSGANQPAPRTAMREASANKGVTNNGENHRSDPIAGNIFRKAR